MTNIIILFSEEVAPLQTTMRFTSEPSPDGHRVGSQGSEQNLADES